MSRFQHTARLHEETVQKIAAGDKLLKKQRQHTTTKHACWGVTVNRAVMDMVRRIRRPGTTIRIINEGEVLIINKEK